MAHVGWRRRRADMQYVRRNPWTLFNRDDPSEVYERYRSEEAARQAAAKLGYIRVIDLDLRRVEFTTK